MDRKYDVITLGEILLRLSTPINGRLAQGDTLMKHLGGAELNIASEIGQLGLKTAIISKIPNNLLAAFIKNQLNASRVSENYLIEDHSDDSRVGIYYYEYGSYPRKPRVVYDRKHSSINNIDIKDVPATMFYNTRLFHTSGITLGLGGNAQKFAIECIRKFKENGTLISADSRPLELRSPSMSTTAQTSGAARRQENASNPSFRMLISFSAPPTLPG